VARADGSDLMDPQTKAAVLQEIEAVLEREVEKA
jgi:hypothetical protein